MFLYCDIYEYVHQAKWRSPYAADRQCKMIKTKKLKYTQYPGEAVFYGPKIDVLVEDAIGRKWQLNWV